MIVSRWKQNDDCGILRREKYFCCWRRSGQTDWDAVTNEKMERRKGIRPQVQHQTITKCNDVKKDQMESDGVGENGVLEFVNNEMR